MNTTVAAATLLFAFSFVPEPRLFDAELSHAFTLRADTPIVVADTSSEDWRTALKDILPPAWQDCPVTNLSRNPEHTPAIYLVNLGQAPESLPRFIKKQVSRTTPPPQGFRVDIDKDRVVVVAPDDAGLWHGVLSLVERMGQDGRIPGGYWEDWPDSPLRGVVTTSAPSQSELLVLARARVNVLLFRHQDFYQLQGPTATTWQRVFDLARRYHIEPVPILDPFNDARSLVRRFPMNGEGRNVLWEGTLGDAWHELDHGVIIDDAQAPLEVASGNWVALREVDYAVIEGASNFDDASLMAWSLRRMPDAAFSDNAPLSIRYDYVSKQTRALCPTAHTTRAIYERIVREVQEVLSPTHIAIVPAPCKTLGRDRRCQDTRQDYQALYEKAAALSCEALRNAAPAVGIMVLDSPKGPYLFPRELLPPGTLLIGQDAFAGPPYDVTLIENPVTAFGLLNSETQDSPAGLLVDDLGDQGKAVLHKLWHRDARYGGWPKWLNNRYGVSLWQPQHDQVLETIAAFLNNAVRRGAEPDELDQQIRAWRKLSAQESLDEDPDVVFAEEAHAHMVEYLALERQYAQDRGEFSFRPLVDLVYAHSALRQDFQEDRANRIESIIRDKKVIVPSTILFGLYLLPCRDITVPEDALCLPLPAEPIYQDEPHRATATFDLGLNPGQVYRVDFETVGAATVTVSGSEDGKDYRVIKAARSTERGGVLAPIMLSKPTRARYIRVVSEAPAEQAVLRTVQLQAWHRPRNMTCPLIISPPHIDGRLSETAWQVAPQYNGFITEDGASFAAFPSQAQLVWNPDALYFGATLHEPRMDTLRARHEKSDAPLWEDDAFELLLVHSDGRCFRFVCNASGVGYDARDGQVHWQSGWDIQTASQDRFWTVEARIPFDALGGSPRPGTTWSVRWTRHRHNLKAEQSYCSGEVTLAF